MNRFKALFVGLLFLVVMTSTAVASCHEGCISNGPLDEGQDYVLSEAQRLGVASNPQFIGAMQQFKAVTGKYSYDLGFVYDCQNDTSAALQVLADRLAAFSAINEAIGIVQASGSTMLKLSPINGVSHVETVTAIGETWPYLKSLSPEVLAAAKVTTAMANLERLESQNNGTLWYEFGDPIHWRVTHSAAAEVRKIHQDVHAHLQHVRMQQMLLISLVLGISAAAFFIRRRQQRRISQAITA